MRKVQSEKHLKLHVRHSENGFSLVESTIALVVLLIVVLGVFSAIIYAIDHNRKNNTRSEALGVLQKEIEDLRSAKFNSTLMDSVLSGGIKPKKKVLTNGGNRFEVEIQVDDDPFTDGIQIDNNLTLKEIYLEVSALSPTPGWQNSVPTSAVVRRVKAN